MIRVLLCFIELYLLNISVNTGVIAVPCSAPEISMCDCDDPISKIECGGRGLTSVPTNIPNDRQQIGLSNNNISTLSDDSFSGLYAVIVLALHKNQISFISPNAFNDLTFLFALTLSDNLLVTLPESVFLTNTDLFHLEIFNNPTQCCLMKGFITWMIETTTPTSIYSLDCKDFGQSVLYTLFDFSNCSTPTDGHWSEWENSTCSVTCGTGIVRRNRTCNNPSPSDGGENCTGTDTDIVECTLDDCSECPTHQVQESIVELCKEIIFGQNYYGNAPRRRYRGRVSRRHNMKKKGKYDKEGKRNKKNKYDERRNRSYRQKYHVNSRSSSTLFDSSSKEVECHCPDDRRKLQLVHGIIDACTDIIGIFKR